MNTDINLCPTLSKKIEEHIGDNSSYPRESLGKQMLKPE